MHEVWCTTFAFAGRSQSGHPLSGETNRARGSATAAYRALQPFGQIPEIETDELKLFESGAIVLHIAESSEALMPSDANGRARTRAWMFAALNSVEAAIDKLAEIDLFHAAEAWVVARRPIVVEAVQMRLTALEDWLDCRDYLEDRFKAGDLLMTTVLRILRHTGIVSGRPALQAYQERCEPRSAFQKALAGHLKPFETAAA